MTFSLFALIRRDNNFSVKAISLSMELQETLKTEFENQYDKFISGVDEDVDFDGDWKPDENQFLCLPEADIEGIDTMKPVIDNNISSFDLLSLEDDGECIKSIFCVIERENKKIILVQKFHSNQILSHNWRSLFLQGNVFNKLESSVLQINSSITAFLINGKLKFKSFHSLRSIFDVMMCFMEATDEMVATFCTHSKIKTDSEQFKSIADTVIRKKITAINKSEVLENYEIKYIQEQYKKYFQRDLLVENDKIVLSINKKEVKHTLDFLLENVFKGVLSSQSYKTNSKSRL
ncbi:Kiwa anti-phage protein KwaB-like domain-containing protein [Pasteurella testudinis]|uniref:Kiwa anti-phage protein KwaB-like domain-containing protein n=1 Tax=Pasteurella testudinis TaxID=761 RepID=UPI004059679B